MALNEQMQRLFGGCGCGCDFDFMELLPILLIGGILLLGDDLVEFICCNGEIVLVFLVILVLLLFM